MGKKIKILYQFATAKLKTPNGDKEVLKRKKFLEKNIGTNTTIKLSIPNKGPGTIESDFDEAIATPNVIESIIAAEKKGYDVRFILTLRNWKNNTNEKTCRAQYKLHNFNILYHKKAKTQRS